jgi:RNA polymerase sigma-70 factor (ECF subfamily)
MTVNEHTLREQSDSALMLSYRSGDPNGFDILYERHKKSVFRFFYFGTGGDAALATELFQDVWMTMVRGRKRYHKEISFTDWLHHVAWARLYDHIRLHPQPEQDNETPRAVDDGLPSNVVALQPKANSADDDLIAQLKVLSDEHREIVLLRYCFRMSFTDIAHFLDVARSSVNRLHREALVCLRQNQKGVG